MSNRARGSAEPACDVDEGDRGALNPRFGGVQTQCRLVLMLLMRM